MLKKIIYVLLMVSAFSQAVYAATAAQPKPTSQTVEREVSFYVKEMTCQLCVYLVNKELRALDGVIKTKANMNEHTVKVIENQKLLTSNLFKLLKNFTIRQK